MTEKIVISGGSSGLGKALVETFLRQGHDVFAFARSEEKLQALHQKMASCRTCGHFYFTSFDLLSGDFSSLAGKVSATLGKVTRMVNNAGMLLNKPFLETAYDEAEDLFRVNVMVLFPLIQHLFPLMVSGTHIVNITSMGGFQGSVKFPGLSAYSASKGALSVLTESMAAEFSEHHIFVNALALGAVQTDMLSAAFPGYKAPLTAPEMAGFVADFTLTGNRFFNGKILPVSVSTP